LKSVEFNWQLEQFGIVGLNESHNLFGLCRTYQD